MAIKIRKLIPDLAEDYVHFFDITPHDDNVDEHKCYCVCWCNDNYEGKDFNSLYIDADTKLKSYGHSVWWSCFECGISYEMSLKTKLLYHKRNQKSCGYRKGYRNTKTQFF